MRRASRQIVAACSLAAWAVAFLLVPSLHALGHRADHVHAGNGEIVVESRIPGALEVASADFEDRSAGSANRALRKRLETRHGHGHDHGHRQARSDEGRRSRPNHDTAFDTDPGHGTAPCTAPFSAPFRHGASSAAHLSAAIEGASAFVLPAARLELAGFVLAAPPEEPATDPLHGPRSARGPPGSLSS